MSENKMREGFVVLGAGLPRTGTLSSRAALSQLLGGPCYHMVDVFTGSSATLDFWNKAMEGKLTKEEWQEHLQSAGFRAGVDFPISLFYK